ncbi:hypothetical protein [Luteolibacter sp. Populi]|uniref:hypothetical protein n=1 Tax=Luteolibacter sp. Populi TaxID=3230487 RepID=UPI0034651385
MKSKSLPLPLLLAAALFPALPVQATVPSPLVLNFTFFIQASEVTEGNLFKGEVEAVRLNSKDLLALLATQTVQTFPKGARIVVDPDGDVYVTDKNGVLIVDVSAFAFADFGGDLFNGVYNTVTEQEKSKIYIAFGLELNLPVEGLVLNMTGLAKENFSASKPNNQGTQTLKGKIACTVTGRGTLESSLILGEGKIDLTGKEVETDL